MINCANFGNYITSTFDKNSKKRFDIFTFFPVFDNFDLPNDLKIQIWPDPSNIIWGCSNFSFLWTFWSGHSFCLKSSFYFLKKSFFLYNSFRLSKLCQMNKNFVKSRRIPFEQSLFLFVKLSPFFANSPQSPCQNDHPWGVGDWELTQTSKYAFTNSIWSA